MKTFYKIAIAIAIIISVMVTGYFIGYCKTLNSLQIAEVKQNEILITDQFGEGWVYLYE